MTVKRVGKASAAGGTGTGSERGNPRRVWVSLALLNPDLTPVSVLTTKINSIISYG